MGKTSKINSFFKRVNVSPTEENVGSSVDHVTIDTPSPPTKIQRIDTVEFDINSLERDPGLRRKIWEYPVNRRDEVRRAYITLHGPNRPDLGKKYPYTLASAKARPRRFQAPWFALFSWLEYSVAKNKAFCFPCFLFAPPDGSSFAGHSAFVVEGFDGWRKVNSGKTCSFRLHEGVNSDSCHRTAEHKWKEIQNPTQNIERVIVKFSAEQVFNNRIRLKISIDLVRRLAFQAMPFRGHDEKSTSNNRGKYKKMSRVYIGNLDERVSERDLEDDFRSFGVIRNVWVARRPPGYAFIDFDDKRDAQDAIRECDGTSRKNGWKVEMSHNSRNGGGGDRGGRGGGRGRSGGSDLKCYECGEAGHFARECRSRGGGGGGGGRRRSRSRTPPSRYRKSPSYGQRSPSPRARSLKRRSLSPRGRSYSRSPLPYRGREEVPYANGNGRDRYRSRS